jgi:pimeloyl-ACP methyl ester carboxylesterase
MNIDINGKPVFADTGGTAFDSSQPTVIFLHGSGLDHTFWTAQSSFLASSRYSVLALDLPGHAKSEGPALKTIESMADWLANVVDSLDVNNVSIVGHSQGGLVALEFASRYAGCLRCVSLMGGGLAMKVNAAMLDAAVNKPEDAIEMMMSWGFGPVDQSVLDIARATMLGNTPGALAVDLMACNDYLNGEFAAGALTCPVQVIVAGLDRMAPGKVTAQLIENLNEPEVHLLPNSGHMIPLETPDECRELLRSFIFSNNPIS